MIVTAIDPGNERSAIIQWDGKEILHHEIVPNPDLLEFIYCLVSGVLVLEMVASYGMAVGKTVFETCVWIGRFQQACPIPAHLIYRMEVKNHFCHTMRAKDSNIRQALIDRFGEPGTKKAPGRTYGIKADEWQALALAVYYHDKEDTP